MISPATCKGCREPLVYPAVFWCSQECQDGDAVRTALTPTLLVTGVDHSIVNGQDSTTMVTMRSVDGVVEVMNIQTLRTDIKPGQLIKPMRKPKP